MTRPPRTGMCQGNFAAVVKEILPINECGLLSDRELDHEKSQETADDSRQ
jgi:hypothetical protein